jgi:DNA repair exonuclease SbcCD ATPase subunit
MKRDCVVCLCLMKKIVFEKVRLQNFLSFGNTPIEFEYKNGVTFVTGWNKDKNTGNGVGKTTLLVESISFALFGETYRKIVQSDVVNSHNKDECVVELWFTVNTQPYKIVRSVKPNKLYLYKGQDDISKTVTETNKDVLNILGISKQIFNNTLVMTNDAKNKFLDQTKDLKTKFVEGILSLEVFGKMMEQAKKDYNDYTKVVDKSQIVLDELYKSIDNDKRYSTEWQEKKDRQISSLELQIKQAKSSSPVDNTDTINQLKQKVDDISQRIDDLTTKINNVNIKKAGIETEHKNRKEQVRKFDQIKLECPTCKRPYGEHDPAQIEEEKQNAIKLAEESWTELQRYEKAIDKGQKDVRTLKMDKADLVGKINDLTEQQQAFTIAQSAINDLTNKLNDIATQQNPFDKKIEEQTEKSIVLTTKHKELEKELAIREAIRFVASNQGVKAIIINKILDTLNDRLAYYLMRLNSPYTCKFNEFL